SKDGTLLKSTESPAWKEMLKAITTKENLKLIGGWLNFQILDINKGPTPGELERAISSISEHFKTDVGFFGDKGWFVSKQMENVHQPWFEQMPESYRKFIEASASIARKYVSNGNIRDVLPSGV